MNIRILVAAHKEYWMPADEMYMPIHVGKAVSNAELNYQADDEGENISGKNANYSELTGIYWAWKNLDADYIGLVHYRRYISERSINCWWKVDLRQKILSKKTAEKIFQSVDVIVPKRRRYYIETLFDHYDHTHDGEHLRATEQIIRRCCPEYMDAFQQMLSRKCAHMFNMFIMKRDVFCNYCAWLFPILSELEQMVDTTSMTPFEARYMGRISELLLDVWLEKNHISYKEMPYVQLGRTNWPKKIRSFLAAKYKNEKYKQSV